jgi:hypothetical protein
MKNLLAIALLLFALFGLPKPGSDPVVVPTKPTIVIPEPTPEMRAAVSKVADALKGASIADRMLWGEVWTKAGKAVASDSNDTRVVWGDTAKLRELNETALRVAWRRIAGNKEGKYPGLREATESAFAAVLTTRTQNVTPELRDKYVKLCDAIGWAGIGRDQ